MEPDVSDQWRYEVTKRDIEKMPPAELVKFAQGLAHEVMVMQPIKLRFLMNEVANRNQMRFDAAELKAPEVVIPL